MIVVLIHWRIHPDPESEQAFIKHWQTRNSIADRSGLIAEFLSASLPMADFPYITWHLDPESTGDFRSFVTVGLWQDSDAFRDQGAAYFNDGNPLLPFEKYRRRRVIFNPVQWRLGSANLPAGDTEGVI
jgi:hypothetical protein